MLLLANASCLGTSKNVIKNIYLYDVLSPLIAEDSMELYWNSCTPICNIISSIWQHTTQSILYQTVSLPLLQRTKWFIDPYVTHMDQKYPLSLTDLSVVCRPSVGSKLPSVSSNGAKQTRRKNAQTIQICHTYGTSSQSSPLHNQLSQTSELLHATLQ